VLQAGRLGIDTDREAAWLEPGNTQHRRTIAGSQVEHRPAVSGDQAVELADVHLGQLTSGDHAHERES
jgi:hypothetical protein